jgi:ubiquinone biosynthesis protein COQ9
MSDTEFDTALVTAAFRLAGDLGWRDLTVAAAAREGGLSLVEARERFPSRAAILLRFGRLADQAALIDASTDGTVRDRLFDLLMRRFDVMQSHRAGVTALLRFLPTHPSTALLLARATKLSMRWMLQAAGVPATGAHGEVQVRGMIAVWLWGIRAWDRDVSEDLSGTMAAIDNALQRAEQVASWLHGQSSPAPSSSVPESDMDQAPDLDQASDMGRGPDMGQEPANPPPIEDPPLPEPKT